MAKRDVRFRKGTSQRSGFDYKYRELVKDGPFLVGPDEYDSPPPSRIPLGGEGDINQGSYFRNTTSTDVAFLNPTFFINSADGISPTFEHRYMRVTGSNGIITIAKNPQISAGSEGQFLTLFCAGSGITLTNGNGVATLNSTNIVMTSGSISVFMFNTGNNAWRETSRISNGGFGG